MEVVPRLILLWTPVSLIYHSSCLFLMHFSLLGATSCLWMCSNECLRQLASCKTAVPYCVPPYTKVCVLVLGLPLGPRVFKCHFFACGSGVAMPRCRDFSSWQIVHIRDIGMLLSGLGILGSRNSSGRQWVRWDVLHGHLSSLDIVLASKLVNALPCSAVCGKGSAGWLVGA